MTATWVLLLGVPVDILLSFGYSPCARPFWRQSALRQHGVIDSFLCDGPPAANYRDAELQDVFNVHQTSFNYLAELTHKKGDFFPLVSTLVAHMHGDQTETKELMGRNAVKHEVDSISAQFACLCWHKGGRNTWVSLLQ